MTPLFIDPAVGSKELLEPLCAMGLPAVSERIDADLAFEGKGIGGESVIIGVEYKKLSELVQSLRSERLQGHQLPKMQYSMRFRWLLIEGEVHQDTHGLHSGGYTRHHFGMTLGELYKRLLVLQLNGGLIPMFTETTAHSLRWIEALYRTWTDKNLDEHTSHIAIYEPAPLVPIGQFRRTIRTLPGIDMKRSALADTYFGGCIRQAINAPALQWAQIEGIGMKIANRVVEAVR